MHTKTEDQNRPRKLRQRRVGYRAFFENSTEGFILADLVFGRDGQPVDCIFVDMNPASERIIGSPRKRILRRKMSSIDHELARKLLKVVFRVATEASPSTEYMEIPSGRWVEVRIDLLDRRTLAFVLRDTTERRKAEIASEKFQALVETTSDFVWEMDSLGRYTYCSPQMESLWGFRPDQAIGRTPFDNMPDQHRVAASEYMRRVAETPRPFKLEIDSYNSKGELVNLEVSGVPFFEADGRLAGFRGMSRDSTSRRLAQEGLRQSEKRYRELVENSNSIVMRADKDLKITYMNGFGLEFFGYTAEEIIGKNAIGTTIPARDPAGRDLAKMARDIVLHPDLYRTNTHQNMRKDGGLVWVSWTNNVIRNDNGEVEEILAIGNDISVLKKTEEALQESESKATALIKYAPTGIYEIDLRGPTMVSVNDAMCSMSGYSREEYLKMNPMEILDEPSQKLFAERIKRHLSGAAIDDSVAYHVRKKDGSWMWVTLNVSFSKEKPFLAFVIGHDVTERQKIEDALRESEEKYHALFSSMTEGFALCKLIENEDHEACDFTYVEVNEAFAKFLEIEPGRLVGRTLTELFPGVPYPELKIYAQVANGGGPSVTERYDPRVKKWFQNYVYSPRTGYFVRFMMDISDRKRVEQIKDEFIGMVSHELKTPLTVVTGALNVAMSGAVQDDEKRQLLVDAAWGAEVMADIVENLLELSRYQSNRLQLRKETLDLGELVQLIVDRYSHKSEKHRVVSVIEGDLPRITADRTRIERVLENLLDNAIKYSPNGGRVRVSVRKETNRAVVSVQDDGIGICESDIKKLFEPFQRLETPVQGSAIQGVGLGLVVCKRLVEAHDGRIWVNSEVGGGSTFSFTIPTSSSAGD